MRKCNQSFVPFVQRFKNICNKTNNLIKSIFRIKRHRAQKRKWTGQKNLFDRKAVILEHPPRRISEMQDGPPKLETDWLGNLEQPAYRTDHRDSFQSEQTHQRQSAHPLSVVRLAYGYTDALKPRFQSTYNLHFQHPELRINH